MLPALICAIEAIWRSVVAEKPCWRKSFAADSRIKSRDFSDFEAESGAPGACLRLPVPDGGVRDRSSERTDCALFRGRLFEAGEDRRAIVIFQVATRSRLLSL